MKDIDLLKWQKENIDNCIDTIDQLLSFTALSDHEKDLLINACNNLEKFRHDYKPVMGGSYNEASDDEMRTCC